MRIFLCDIDTAKVTSNFPGQNNPINYLNIGARIISFPQKPFQDSLFVFLLCVIFCTRTLVTAFPRPLCVSLRAHCTYLGYHVSLLAAEPKAREETEQRTIPFADSFAAKTIAL